MRVVLQAIELGVALRTGNARRSFALSLYAAPFASIGYAYGAYEFNFVLGSPRQVPASHRGITRPFTSTAPSSCTKTRSPGSPTTRLMKSLLGSTG